MYNHIGSNQPTIATFKKLVEFWPIIIIWPTILGYLAFNIYASNNGILYPRVEVHLIIGLGIFNLLTITLTYYTGLNVKRFRTIHSLRITFYIYFLVIEPRLILLVLFIELISKAFSSLKILNTEEKKTHISKLRKIVSRQNIYEIISSVSVLLLIFLMAFFIDSNILIVWSFFYFSLEVINHIRNNFKKQIYYLLIITLLTPFITSLYVIDNTNHTIFGTSNKLVEVKVNDEIIKGQLNYQSAEFIYLSNDTSYINIPVTQILKITEINEAKKLQGFYHHWFSEE